MTTTPPATRRDEPAFVAAAARLAQLADPSRPGVPSMAAALLQYAHNELTDYGMQQPARSLEVTIDDPSEEVADALVDLTRLFADAGDLSEALRVTRAIDYTREAAAVRAESALGGNEPGSLQ